MLFPASISIALLLRSDNFFNADELAEVLEEIKSIPDYVWYFGKHDPESVVQQKKSSIENVDYMTPLMYQMVNKLASKEMLSLISDITGIPDLQNDEELVGAGLHRTLKDGKLSIHSDFNIHPNSKKHRRVNAFLYLNKDWDPEYNGELEIWDKDMTACQKKIEPIFNRLILLKTCDDAYHGHPEKWEADINMPRLSFEIYYYTEDRPEDEITPFHWAIWKERPDEGY
jgi:hypothetical protein